jgi:hypothetical protein
VLRLKLPQAAAEAVAFAELFDAVGAAVLRPQQRRHGVPAVAGEHARRAVVAGGDEDVGLEGHDLRHGGVEFLGPLHLRIEVAVFAGAVGVLEVDEEEVVLVPVLFENLHLLVERLGMAEDVHADELGEALVHRVDGDRGGAEAVDLFVAGNARLAGDAAEGAAVGLFLGLEEFLRLANEFLEDLRGRFALGVAGDGVERRHARDLRVGVVNEVAELALVGAGAAEDHDEAVFLHRFDEDLHVGDLHFAQLDRERRALFAGDAAGAAVANFAGGVERAEVRADGDVAFFELEADAGRFEGAAADEVGDRIVTEQAEVAGTAAGGDAGGDGDAAATDAFAYELVEVGGLRGFKFGEPARLLRQAAQAVGDEHDDLRVVLDEKLTGEGVGIHGGQTIGWRWGRNSEPVILTGGCGRGQGHLPEGLGWGGYGESSGEC